MAVIRSDVTWEYIKENFKIVERKDLYCEGRYVVEVVDKKTDIVIGVTECNHNVWRIRSDHGFEVAQLEKAIKRVVDVYLRFHLDFLQSEGLLSK